MKRVDHMQEQMGTYEKRIGNFKEDSKINSKNQKHCNKMESDFDELISRPGTS